MFLFRKILREFLHTTGCKWVSKWKQPQKARSLRENPKGNNHGRERIHYNIRELQESRLLLDHSFKYRPIYRYIGWGTSILSKTIRWLQNFTGYHFGSIWADISQHDWYIGRYPRWKCLIYSHVTHLRSFCKSIWGVSTKCKYPLWVYDPKLALSSFIWFM